MSCRLWRIITEICAFQLCLKLRHLVHTHQVLAPSAGSPLLKQLRVIAEVKGGFEKCPNQQRNLWGVQHFAVGFPIRACTECGAVCDCRGGWVQRAMGPLAAGEAVWAGLGLHSTCLFYIQHVCSHHRWPKRMRTYKTPACMLAAGDSSCTFNPTCNQPPRGMKQETRMLIPCPAPTARKPTDTTRLVSSQRLRPGQDDGDTQLGRQRPRAAGHPGGRSEAAGQLAAADCLAGEACLWGNGGGVCAGGES